MVPAAMLVVFGGMTATASGFPPAARLLPLVVGVPAILLAAWELWRTWSAAAPDASSGPRRRAGQGVALAWFAGFVLALVAGGFVVGGIAAVMIAQRFWLRESWRTACLGGVAAWAVVAGAIERGLGQPLFEGVITGWARAWLGI
jgi:hypothetical protein